MSEAQVRFERTRDGLAIAHGNENLDAVFVVGRSRLGDEMGIEVHDLPSEGYRIRSIGNVIFIAGQDGQKADLTPCDPGPFDLEIDDQL